MNRAVAIYKSSVGKKYVMAITGLIGCGFVLAHMSGNLLMFQGPDKMNAYGEFLQSLGGLLWAFRLLLLTAVALHVVAAYQLSRMSLISRPVGYEKWEDAASTYASRTMRWSGPLILVFIVYHILDFTIGKTNPNFVPGDVYGNVIASFSVWYISVFYLISMLALGLHLYHGFWSMFQSLGLSSTKFESLIRRVTLLITIVLILGFISVPIAVMTGYLS